MAAGENFKFIFREAKINDAILFFDKCEAIFETREKGSQLKNEPVHGSTNDGRG